MLEEFGIISFRLLLAVILSGLIGWERDINSKPGGMRTHILVAVGVVLICEVSRHFAGPESDPTRIAAQIVTGIGFLGAGAILRLGPEVKGLTSAATIWASAGIAMAVSTGGSMTWIAIFAALLVLFTLSTIERIEQKLAPHKRTRILSVSLDSREHLHKILETLEDSGCQVKGIRTAKVGDRLDVSLDLTGKLENTLPNLLKVHGVLEAQWVD